jgi:hypothetical protein
MKRRKTKRKGENEAVVVPMFDVGGWGFRFRSKRGKCERKPFRLEPKKKKLEAKPAHPSHKRESLFFILRSLFLSLF